MAYINQETKSKIMAAIKKEFPSANGWTITGKVEHYSSLCVTIRKAPINMMEGLQGNGYTQCGHSMLSEYPHKAIIDRIDAIIRKEGNWFDKSDAMTDYFHTAFYHHINIGEWNKPFSISK